MIQTELIIEYTRDALNDMEILDDTNNYFDIMIDNQNISEYKTIHNFGF